MNKSGFPFGRFWIYLFMTFLLACNLPVNRSASPTPFFPTFVPSTSPAPAGYLARPTISAPTRLPMVQPSLTLAPIVFSTNTSIPIPCNRAEFLGDASIPDGTQISVGAAYTKVWRLRNAGSCTWTSGYVLLFDHGDPMNASSGQPLSFGTVPPGAAVDVSVTLSAPSTPGTYQAYFRLRSPDNIVFGIGPSGQDPFWVRIVVPPPTAAPTLTPEPPSFAEILQFGGGGARAGLCSSSHYPGDQPSFYIEQDESILDMCLWGVGTNLPFRLDFTSPDGAAIWPNNFLAHDRIDDHDPYVEWDGYGAPSSQLIMPVMVENGVIPVVELLAWIPIYFPAGEWQVRASGGLQAESNFTLHKAGDRPFIAAINPNFGREYIPIYGDKAYLSFHLLRLKENRKVNVMGTNYPANAPVYVLLYHSSDSATYYLEDQQTIQTDSSGSISIELAGPLTAGDSYLVMGVTHPNTHILDEGGRFDLKLPHDFFKLVSP